MWIHWGLADCVVRTSSQWFYPPVFEVHSLAAIPQSHQPGVQTVGSDFDQTWRVWDGDGWKEDCKTLIFLSWLTCVQRLLNIYLFSQFHANQVHSPAPLSPFQQHVFYFPFDNYSWLWYFWLIGYFPYSIKPHPISLLLLNFIQQICRINALLNATQCLMLSQLSLMVDTVCLMMEKIHPDAPSMECLPRRSFMVNVNIPYMEHMGGIGRKCTAGFLNRLNQPRDSGAFPPPFVQVYRYHTVLFMMLQFAVSCKVLFGWILIGFHGILILFWLYSYMNCCGIWMVVTGI